MVSFVSWREAKARVREEPVIFAEVVSDARECKKLEIHVMTPTSRGLHEAERDDTGCIPGEEVRGVVARIATARNVRYAAIRGAEDHWPPEWVEGRAQERRSMNIVSLRWDGAPSVKAARDALRNGERVDIDLPLETHHALYRHLHPDAPRGAEEEIDAADGVELLSRIANVAGLQELARLAPGLRRGRYRVQLSGPEPRLSLLPPLRERGS